MKKTIRISSLVLFFCVLLSVSVLAYNWDESDVVVRVQINNTVMSVNGVQTQIDEGRDTKPVVVNGRTLVPIRAIIEAFNGTVQWEESTQSVILTMNDDVIKLVINSNIAYLNGNSQPLDVAPMVIGGRTMLPIRFIADGFNLGVAWQGDTQTISIIKNSFDELEYQSLVSILPKYSGKAYTEVNNNKPFFKDYEIINASFEYYGSLDELGRCDVAFASISTDIMPTENRESIALVKPTGWQNATYDIVDGKYLYNRCHLIGYQLTGENANERNLITGTRYLNIEGMLPFENMVDDYIEKTGNQVMYRATPVFTENNLVADGVLIEAYSVEDNGQGISFCVYCYNVQPNIKIDYLTGYNCLDEECLVIPMEQIPQDATDGLYRTPTGKRYHFDKECGGKNSYSTTIEEALAVGLTPCSKCAK